MIDLIFISPLLFVSIGALIVRYGLRKRPFAWMGRICAMVLLLSAMLLPLTQGVWILDFTGIPRSLGEATGTNGDRFEVVQYWNHVDFYTTEVRTTKSDGTTSVVVLDGDARRNSDAAITLDESDRMVKIELDGYPAYVWGPLKLWTVGT